MCYKIYWIFVETFQ